ncbi:MAG TPA: Na(+)/H(+) antiporter subunit B [Thermohalobaculum sp.]|nr:Na(+)/H(+) antiporter subunit B [Thermohalobaculum sp.]
MRLDTILRVCSKIFIPFILVFGFYVLFHGHYGPGGGFQAGVIAAAAIILYAIVFGLAECRRVVPPAVVEAMVPLGVLIFAAVGVWAMMNGGAFLDYDYLFMHDGLPDRVEGQYWGILFVEVGVFVSVAGTMVALFYAFAGRGLT